MPHKPAIPEGDIPIWEHFARADAEYHILTDRPSHGGAEAMERFFATGRQQAATILTEADPWLSGHGKAIEIGCGTGRLTIPMADRFDRMVGVDIAPTMLAKLQANAERFNIPNIQGVHVETGWEADGDADFLYSWLVLQHIDTAETVSRLVGRAAAALAPTGVAHLQFDSRPSTLLYRLRSHLPDSVLPHAWRKGLRRVRRSPEALTALFTEAGLTVLREYRPGTALHSFLLKKA